MFAGKVAVVTGAAVGIGAAIARRLAAKGAAVVLADVSPRVEETAASIGESGGRASAVLVDVADEDAWRVVTAAAHERFGLIDVLVSNAAAFESAPAHELSRASWDRQLAVCLTGAFLGARACLPDLCERRGSLVIISSVHALFGLPGRPAYAAANAALAALTRQLAVEYGPDVRVNCVLPGPVLTEAWNQVSTPDRERSVAATTLKRFGTPDEVAAATTFLASDDASFITGASLVVDGGWSVVKEST